MSYQVLADGQVSPEVPINENMAALGQGFLWAHNVTADSGLVVGLNGGDFDSNAVANATVTGTDNATNYIVAHRTTRALSVATGTTNWNNTTTYGRVARAVFASSVLTYHDERYSAGGIFDHAAGGGAVLADGDYGDIVVSGSGAAINIDSGVLSTYGRTLVDDTTAGAARTTLGLGTAAVLDGDTDTTLAANSDARVATQKATKAYVDNVVTGGAAGVMIFTGVIDCSANPNYPAANAGAVYKVSVAGKLGGASGVVVQVGDTAYCTATAASGNQATVGASWNVVQENIDGAVIGPTSATDLHLAVFDGTTGKLIKDGGVAPIGTNTGDETTTTIGALINGATAKATPVDADELGLMDSAASNVLKKLSWANVKATLKTYFDTLYGTVTQPFDAAAFYPGIPTASAKIARVPIARAVSFAGNFAGSYFSASANATATTVFDVQKNGSSIGSISIASGGTTATFTTTSGTAKTFAAGDVLAIIAPASPDATLADVGFVLAGTR